MKKALIQLWLARTILFVGLWFIASNHCILQLCSFSSCEKHEQHSHSDCAQCCATPTLISFDKHRADSTQTDVVPTGLTLALTASTSEPAATFILRSKFQDSKNPTVETSTRTFYQPNAPPLPCFSQA